MLPECGDLVWIDFDPHTGSEQAGRRPGLVLSPLAYHQRTRLAVVCPITSRVKGFPFEVPLPPGLLFPVSFWLTMLKALIALHGGSKWREAHPKA